MQNQNIKHISGETIAAAVKARTFSASGDAGLARQTQHQMRRNIVAKLAQKR